MPPRTALLHGPDDPTRASIVRTLTADGVAVVSTDTPDPSAAVAEATAGTGALDVLVSWVRSVAPGAFLGRDPQDWYAAVMASLTPQFRLLRAAVPALRRSAAGRIVLVGAGWTPTGRPGGTAGSAVEGAVVALVKTLARDLGPAGITVNEVVGPAGRDDPEGVARAVGYLSSPAAGAVVGQLLTVGAGGELRP